MLMNGPTRSTAVGDNPEHTGWPSRNGPIFMSQIEHERWPWNVRFDEEINYTRKSDCIQNDSHRGYLRPIRTFDGLKTRNKEGASGAYCHRNPVGCTALADSRRSDSIKNRKLPSISGFQYPFDSESSTGAGRGVRQLAPGTVGKTRRTFVF